MSPSTSARDEAYTYKGMCVCNGKQQRPQEVSDNGKLTGVNSNAKEEKKDVLSTRLILKNKPMQHFQLWSAQSPILRPIALPLTHKQYMPCTHHHAKSVLQSLCARYNWSELTRYC